MSLPLYLLISGNILYCGLFLLATGVVTSTWRPSLSRALAWSGLLACLASAVPIHTAWYVALVVLVVGWQIAGSGGQNRMAGAVLGGAALVCGAALLDRVQSGARLPLSDPVFVVGDSLSAGLGASRDDTWPQHLSEILHLPVFNLAKAGATLADGKAQTEQIARGPATVLVELGGNDLLDGTSTSRFNTDLRRLLAALVARNRRVLMFELPLLPFQNSFGRIQRQACREYGVALLPRALLAGALAAPGHTTDGLHLSPAGHLWLAGQVGELWQRP